MLKHIVIWKFKEMAEGASRENNLRKAKSLLDSLPAKIPQIKIFEVGIDILHSASSSDMVLVSGFDNQESLSAYQKHPEHQVVVDFLRRVEESKQVVDYRE